jgi:hypothetical protein
MASANAAGVPPPVKDGFPQIQNEDGSVSEVLAISKHLVGKLIGKGGTTIQQLQATTSTSIQIDQVRTPSCKALLLCGGWVWWGGDECSRR